MQIKLFRKIIINDDDEDDEDGNDDDKKKRKKNCFKRVTQYHQSSQEQYNWEKMHSTQTYDVTSEVNICLPICRSQF